MSRLDALSDTSPFDEPKSSSIQEVPPTSKTTTRYHYMDGLRAIAMLAGILLHAGLAYSVMLQDVWSTANPTGSLIADFFIWLVHTFRMPLFFLIAGFFAHLLIQKRGVKSFIKNRGLRITLPFIIFWPLLIASMFGILIYSATTMELNTPVADMIRLAIENPAAMAGQEPPLSTTHLWFIYYLTFFCIIVALAYRFTTLSKRMYDAIASPLFLLIGLPLLTMPALITQAMPHPAPESFIPTLWALAFFGLFFFVGWVFFNKQDMLDRLERYWIPILAICLVAYATFFLQIPKTPITLDAAMASLTGNTPTTREQVTAAIAMSILSWYLSFLSLMAARKLITNNNRFFRYISDASYWIYIVHLPFLLYLQAHFHSVDLPIFLEFIIVSTATMAFGLLTYAALVRHTPIGWMLNGRRKK